MKSTYTHRLLLLATFCLSFCLAEAQAYVAVPDTNLGTWLYNNGYMGCMTGNNTVGWQLDISSPITQVPATLDISYLGITDLEGLQYITGITSLTADNNDIPVITDLPPFLETFHCQSSGVQSLPYTLPAGIVSLWIDNNSLSAGLPAIPDSCRDLMCYATGITTLPALPAGLLHLDCSLNQLGSLPTLPAGLLDLNCGQNQITSLPTLPDSLQSLNCGQCQLSSLPTLPATLSYLECGANNLSSLPALPASLYSLRCSQNRLTTLPTLPATLQTLDCSRNTLGSLPAVLPAGLTGLQCDNIHLTALPAQLPVHLDALNCDSNYLTTLPQLPANLRVLAVRWNNISTLPALPASIDQLWVTGNTNLACVPRIARTRITVFYAAQTQITCLPSRFSANSFDINPGALPLCDATSGCDFYYNIAGSVHQYSGTTCADDSLHPGAPVGNLKVQLKQGGAVVQQFYTFTSGGYSFKTPGYGSYSVSVDTTALPISVACPQSGSRSVAITATDSVKPYENFALTCAGADFGVSAVDAQHLRPATSTTVHIDAGDIIRRHYGMACGATTAGTLTITLTNAVHYISPAAGALTPSSVAGATLTYTVADLGSLTAGSLDFVLGVDAAAVPGSQVCINVTITPATPDLQPADDQATRCFNVVNSWDPNHKDVSPQRVDPGATDWLTYTVHFQNTGSDTAYLVVLRDTLSANVDAASFQYLASSHPAVIQLDHNAMAFTFPHINLVDSATNPPLSEGWIQYRVRPNAALPNGTVINNTAYIYFDLNPAVVTNTAVTTVQLTTTCVDGYIHDTATICHGDTVDFWGSRLTASGDYNDLIQSPTGCDTTYYLHLTVLPAAHHTISDTICAGSAITFAGHVLTTAGTYYDTLQSAHGCDSIVTLQLTVGSVYIHFVYDTICAGSIYTWAGHPVMAAGSYDDSLHTAYGCDSVVTLRLYVRPASHMALYDTICAGGSYTFAGHVLTVAGMYGDTLSSAVGCDSILTLYLAERGSPITWPLQDTLVSVWCGCYHWIHHPQLTALPAGGHYTGGLIQGDTLSFLPNHCGLEVLDTVITLAYTYDEGGGCTSYLTKNFRYLIGCEWGINDISALASIHIYPDPNTGTFTLQTERSYGLSYRISDILGKEIQQGTVTADTQKIQLPEVADGVYTITVDGARPLRFVVVR